MQVKPAALARHLGGTLAPIYLISGEETLLVEEACDAIIAAAQAAGFTERSVQHVESGFRWNDLLQDAANLSLFASRRIIDVRTPVGRLDREASDVLRTYVNKPPEDTLVMLRTGGLDKRKRSSAWFKAIEKTGVVVLIWPVRAVELPNWLEARLKRSGLLMEKSALRFFAERVEGNLLAAVQEISALKLAGLPQPIDVDSLVSVLADSAHYDTFELLDAVFAGDAPRVARMLEGLAAEGVAPFAIIGALAAQLRRLRRGDYVPPQRQRLIERFLARIASSGGIDQVLAECAVIDQQGKGQLLGDAWISLENLLVRLAGAPLIELEQELPYLVRP